MTEPTTRVTRAGQTLTAYAWWSLEAAYRRAGMDPDTYMVVVQGSFKAGHGASASGSTHDAGDTADLRTRNLPSSVRANLCERLVVALREAGWCAWYRDQAHGGMDPHVHAVYRWADPAPSSGARWQVGEYDAGRDGLSSGGRDYHPRPKQTRYPWPGDTTTPDPAIGEDEDMAFLFKTHKDGTPDGQAGGGAVYVVLNDGHAFQVGGGYKANGLPVVESPDEKTDERFYATTIRNQR